MNANKALRASEQRPVGWPPVVVMVLAAENVIVVELYAAGINLCACSVAQFGWGRGQQRNSRYERMQRESWVKELMNAYYGAHAHRIKLER